MDDYIKQLELLIKEEKIQEARTALARFKSLAPGERHRAIEVLALAPDKMALDLLDFLLDSGECDGDTTQALFQLVIDRAHLHYPFVLVLLKHGDPERIRHSIPLFKHILTKATGQDLLDRIIRTAGTLGLDTLIDEIAEFVFYDDPVLKSSAIRTLERLGTDKARKKLELIAATEKADQDVLDALAFLKSIPGKIQEDPSLPEAENRPVPDPVSGPREEKTEADPFETHLSLLSSNVLEERFRGVQYFAQRGSLTARALSRNLDTKDADLLITLLWLVSTTIPQEAVKDLFTLIMEDQMDNRVKFCLYNALEAYPELESGAMILKGIGESSDLVKTAALKALEKHCSDYVVAEIKKQIESGSKAGKDLVRTILDIRAQRLTESLLVSDSFSYNASNHLETKAALPVLDAYIKILEKRNLASTLKRYQSIRDKKAREDSPVIMVVSPSNCYLEVYARMIHSWGYEARTFKGTQQAFEAMMEHKPLAVILSLLLNNMTCLDFALETREVYSQEDLPLIVSPILQNLDASLEQEMNRTGITARADFPARAAQIKSWINQS